MLLSSIFAVSLRAADAPAPAAPPQRYLYLMSKPVQMDVQIGQVGKALHYSYWAFEILFKTGLAYAGSGHLGATAAFFMFTLAHSTPYITAHSMADIKVRQALRSSWMARKLRDVPGIERAIIMSGGQLEFDGPLVRARKSSNYVFVETTEPLPSEGGAWVETFGKPIDVSNSAATRVTFEMKINGRPNTRRWEASLIDVLDGKAIPEEVAEAWRSDVKDWDAQARTASRIDYYLGKHNRAVRVDASVSLPTGETLPIDAMINGGQVRKLLGMSFLQKVKDFFAEKVLGRELVERSVDFDRKIFPVKKCERLLRDAIADSLPGQS